MVKFNYSILLTFIMVLMAIINGSATTPYNAPFSIFVIPDSSLIGKQAFLELRYHNGHSIYPDSLTIDGNAFHFDVPADTMAYVFVLINGTMNYAMGLPENQRCTLKADLQTHIMTGGLLNDERARMFVETEKAWQKLYSTNETAKNDSTITSENKKEIIGQAQNELRALLDSLCIPVLKSNDNPLGIYALGEWFKWYRWEYQGIEEGLALIDNNVGPFVKNSSVYSSSINILRARAETSVGKPIKDYTFENSHPQGAPLSIHSYLGQDKYLLLDFWASWCGPCIKSIPELKEVQYRWNDKLEVVGISVNDEIQSSLQAIEKHNMDWPQLLSNEERVNLQYGLDYVPCCILLDPDGTILAIGPLENITPILETIF
ncbi:MAG: TlpA family protein disulfide reductase [Bacteroidales bacterium]|nr:TlpA family protein disulfide reductase [Bacteroidales bacterium]